jgi:integrase
MPGQGRARDGLYKRGSRWWMARDPITGRRLSTGCRDREAARRVQAARERLAADPTYTAEAAETIGDWIVKTHAAKASRPEGTRHMYRTKLGHVARLFGDRAAVASIAPAAVDRYVAQRRAESADDATIGKEISCLTQLVKLARRAGAWQGDPSSLRPVGFSSTSKPRKRWLTPDELERLRAVLKPKRFAWVAFVVATGARTVEVQAARPTDYDPRTGVVLLRGTKTPGAERGVPILPLFADLWAAAWAELRARGHLDWVSAAKLIPVACRRVGIAPATPNDLRRTHSSWLAQRGVDRDLIARILGHTSTRQVFRTYSQIPAAELGRLLTRELAGTDPAHPGRNPHRERSFPSKSSGQSFPFVLTEHGDSAGSELLIGRPVPGLVHREHTGPRLP